MIAAENGNVETARALIQNGADVHLTNKKGETAWDFADSDEIKTLLESYGSVALKQVEL